MDLSFTPEQDELRTAVRDTLAGLPDPAAWERHAAVGPGYDPRWWDAALRVGPAAAFPGVLDLAIVAEELGRAAAPSPLHNGVVQSGLALLAAGDARAHAEHLRPLLRGERRYAFCLAEPDGGYGPASVRTRAVREGGGRVLTGTKCFVPYAAGADVLLVVARDAGGETLFAVDARQPGVSVRPIPTIGGDRQCAIELAGVRVGDGSAIGEPGGARGALRPALDRASIVLAADLAGAAGAALDHVVRRVGERRQWGVPIGSFQAVRHRCADMLLDVTLARDAAYEAASVADRGEDAGLAAATARALCAARCREVAAAAHQLHGGEGIHADVPLHLWYRRIKAAEPVLGDPRSHRETVAAALLGPPERSGAARS